MQWMYSLFNSFYNNDNDAYWKLTNNIHVMGTIQMETKNKPTSNIINQGQIIYRDDKKILGDVDIKTVIKNMFGNSTELHNLAIQIYEAETEINIKKLLTPKNDYEAMVLFCGLVNLFTYNFDHIYSNANDSHSQIYK